MLNPLPEALLSFLADAAFGEIKHLEKLNAGHINQNFRLTTASQDSFILKRNVHKPRLFEYEAAGLKVLGEAGIRTPKVLAYGDDFLLLEDLGSDEHRTKDWAQLGRVIAQMHQHSHTQFGFHYDNYLGSLPQINTWTDNGHEFFAQHRVLRYLREEQCEKALTAQDRRNLERLLQRLPDLVPSQAPALLHGDLWHTNILFDADSTPSLIDPAVYYGWPEAELSMTRQYGNIPQVFYDAYIEVNPLENGWWDRLELLTIRQCMAVLAFFGNQYNTVEELRAVIAKFS